MDDSVFAVAFIAIVFLTAVLWATGGPKGVNPDPHEGGHAH